MYAMKMKKCFWILLCVGLLQASFGHAEFGFVFSDSGAAQQSEGAWTYPVPLEVLEDPEDVLRLINRENLLDKAYPDQDIDMYKLVEVTAPVTKGSHSLRGVVNDALAALIADAETEGIKLYVGSTYRNYRAQEVMHYNRVKELGKDDGIVQMAGASEHQAGLAADVVSWAYKDKFQTSFGDTAEGQWLAANCARYGFIIRYPKDKVDITGVKYEPWHVRYVGVEAATYIMASGLTLEEFTQEWQQALEAYRQANPEG